MNTFGAGGFNETAGGGGIRGWHHTDSAKELIARASRGKKHTDEARKNMSKAQKGKKMSEEARKNMSAAKKGKFLGELSPNAKLTKEDIIKIKKCLLNDERAVDLASQFCVSSATISHIQTGRLWSHILPETLKRLKKVRNKLTGKDVIEIKKALREGVKQSFFVKKFGVSQTCISNINTGRRWSHIKVEGA